MWDSTIAFGDTKLAVTLAVIVASRARVGRGQKPYQVGLNWEEAKKQRQ